MGFHFHRFGAAVLGSPESSNDLLSFHQGFSEIIASDNAVLPSNAMKTGLQGHAPAWNSTGGQVRVTLEVLAVQIPRAKLTSVVAIHVSAWVSCCF